MQQTAVSAATLNAQFRQNRLDQLERVRRSRHAVKWNGHNPVNAPACDGKGHAVAGTIARGQQSQADQAH